MANTEKCTGPMNAIFDFAQRAYEHVTNLKEINAMTKQRDNTPQSSQRSMPETQASGETGAKSREKPADLEPRVLKESDTSKFSIIRDKKRE